MAKRYEFYGTHYNKDKKVLAAVIDRDDNTIVMYVNQQKIYEGDVDNVYEGIVDWLVTDATVSNKFSLVDWCNSFGDKVFTDEDIIPPDEELADVVAQIINDDYDDSEVGNFYMDGDGYINMEIFLKSDEIVE